MNHAARIDGPKLWAYLKEMARTETQGSVLEQKGRDIGAGAGVLLRTVLQFAGQA